MKKFALIPAAAAVLTAVSCAFAAEAPVIELDGSAVNVTNAPDNSTLIIAAYDNGVLSGVKTASGSGAVTADVSEYLAKSEKIRAFLWDMENIMPLGEPKAVKDTEDLKMEVRIGDAVFTATLEDNTAVDELVSMMRDAPVTVHMSDYGEFEKVGPLGKSLTPSNSQMTTTAGDIVLYNGDQIVMFYGSNSWSYTKLGHIDDLTGWEAALGSGDITAVFSVAE